MNIEFASIEYFVLLDLQSKLLRLDYNKLDLDNLDRLRAEVERKILAINQLSKERSELKAQGK